MNETSCQKDTKLSHRVTILDAEIIVLDIELEVWQNQLAEPKLARETRKRVNEKRKLSEEETEDTSSRIFFQMILVISSPSSSTTGFWTTIFLPSAAVAISLSASSFQSAVLEAAEAATGHRREGRRGRAERTQRVRAENIPAFYDPTSYFLPFSLILPSWRTICFWELAFDFD